MKTIPVVLVWAVVLLGCDSNPVSKSVPVPVGPWGSDMGVLTVADTASTFARICGGGNLPGRLETTDGHFQKTGGYGVDQGGPCCSYVAIFEGDVEGSVMTLTIRNSQDHAVLFGPLTLVKGVTHNFDDAICLENPVTSTDRK